MIKPLPVEKYRNVYDIERVECPSTDKLKPTDEIIGQERAQKALHFGLNIQEKGFNIYVAGVPGTGRKTAVRKFLDELARTKPKANDWIYVNNFDNQYEPIAIELPPGKGMEFKHDMSTFVEEARRALPKAFESEDYVSKRQEALENIEREKAKIIQQINESAEKRGFVIQMGPTGLMIIPVKDGKPLSEEDFNALSEQDQQEIQDRRKKLDSDLRNAFRQLRELDGKEAESIKDLNRNVSLYAIGHLVAGLKEKYQGNNPLQSYLDAVQEDVVNNLGIFLGLAQQQQQQQQQQIPPQLQQWFMRDVVFRKYDVNVIVDNKETEGAPVIFEQTPSYQNLFGKVEKEVQFGVMITDFTMIRPGSVHKANGGYLVVPAEDVLRYPFAYDGLKTALKTEEVAIEEPGERLGYISARGLKPKPMPLATKVVIIGTPQLNQALYMYDTDFSDLFKVKADFDTTMDRDDKNAEKYSLFICTLCDRFKLKHLDNTAVAKVVEYGSRLAADQEKLSTRFAGIADLIKEANFYSTQEKSEYTTAKHINQAIEAKIYRSNLIQEKIQEFIERDIYLIDTEGAKPGQINGLSVMELGDFAFGRPSRVTASIGVGREGIIDIERQANLGGPTHTKGVLILGGYLADKYTQDKPLSLTAKLVFEQSYGGIDGDSASSTELYAIISALSGLPIKQSLAVTGSVNQKGEVQAIGGVNEKLEGFFEVCKAKGLTGEQGAMIPISNVQNLMLKEEILEAAKAGKFTIYPVKTIDEGVEVLTGVPAGQRQKDGTYPEGTVNYLVNKRLKEMAEKIKEFRVPET
jgi:lon-related putative ATP-dependent protease